MNPDAADDKCRRSVDREDEDTLVMRIDSVRRSDQGQYSCESDFDGQLATQHSRLTIHGQLPHRIDVS